MTNWIWLDETVALAVHERSLLLHGGAAGIRDEGLLKSGLARPQHLAAYEDTADLCALAAAYTAGIVKNHPFVDGNKRTGFVVGVLFLELNGAQFVASEEAATHAVLGLAAGDLNEAGYAAFLRGNLAPD
ncbi:MAG TPA: type II toxin-antitoxin system death-on-curing family toxin [Caulobacteraceae bacterium]|nr:type II toxin-antitoxin system death-on-curing family toxin [Caulobacteraceae bacterium]